VLPVQRQHLLAGQPQQPQVERHLGRVHPQPPRRLQVRLLQDVRDVHARRHPPVEAQRHRLPQPLALPREQLGERRRVALPCLPEQAPDLVGLVAQRRVPSLGRGRIAP
jgi:hypothetical protein